MYKRQVFSSSELGAISYAGACSSAKTSAVAGENEITLNHLNDGTYPDCELKVTDVAGNTSVLALDSFTVDTVAPGVTITSQILSLTRDTTPSFVIDVSELSMVAYSGSCSSSMTQVQSGSNEITLNALGDGTYSDCSIQLTDAIGNQGSLYPLGTFRVDTTPPSLNLTTPTTSLVNDPTPSFVFSSSEPGTIAYEGGCSSSVAEAVAGMHAITLNHLSDGQYTGCKLRVTDEAGNAEVLALGSFTVDTIAPTITIATAIPLATNDNTPSFTIHLNEAGEASYSGACSSTSTSVGIGDNTIVLHSLSDGNYSDCGLTITDAAGNAAQIGLGSFTIDTVPPLSLIHI